jgi:hypothetical protein
MQQLNRPFQYCVFKSPFMLQKNTKIFVSQSIHKGHLWNKQYSHNFILHGDESDMEIVSSGIKGVVRWFAGSPVYPELQCVRVFIFVRSEIRKQISMVATFTALFTGSNFFSRT